MTSVRALMQMAVQKDLTLHQMAVKTAYLQAPDGVWNNLKVLRSSQKQDLVCEVTVWPKTAVTGTCHCMTTLQRMVLYKMMLITVSTAGNLKTLVYC